MGYSPSGQCNNFLFLCFALNNPHWSLDHHVPTTMNNLLSVHPIILVVWGNKSKHYTLSLLLSFFALAPPLLSPSLRPPLASVSPPIPLFLALTKFHLDDMV